MHVWSLADAAERGGRIPAGGYPGAPQRCFLSLQSFGTAFSSSFSNIDCNLGLKEMGSALKGEYLSECCSRWCKAQDGFGLGGLSAMQPLCSVYLKVFTAFFIFDLALSRDSSKGSSERRGADHLERVLEVIPVVYIGHLT